ncbi:MAG TPA: hypothetical protein VL287_16300 [Gemmatimonadales bacterium]|jgi:hypothetical protein|nr:hypothetical protein [Gemmatimonadales bacterium]
MTLHRPWLRLLLLTALVAVPEEQAAAQAGTVSTARIVSLAATKTGKLTMGVISGAAQTLGTLTDNTTNNFPTPVVIQTQWDLNPGQTGSVNVIGWFATPSQALTNGVGTNIPSSRMKGMLTPGAPAPTSFPATFTAFTQNAVGGIGTAGGSLRLFQMNISGANKTQTRTDNLSLQLDLTGAGVLPPGTYSGTLNIEAVTQ